MKGNFRVVVEEKEFYNRGDTNWFGDIDTHRTEDAMYCTHFFKGGNNGSFSKYSGICIKIKFNFVQYCNEIITNAETY